ncbi:BlaI/MecI/CopY family transcriptional regulator [Mycobacterium sp. CVI_P3]|uniref:BlaI/MecI/CopY family transcriptional regulator n=1 Tax=Mycobacterium pinniadriaticum TaxID=2994102 RepID=A0ABT3S7Q4_9MYCO|nr:BlaI/MecI/CopY family transcriptional regulator [Mycobacterium pinniadriaticum]MCX2929099.1 BlaI/MecI/CopY family transcriptional regulator [Mycobacterium pinniadriaticum]MCX2935524.1 BlaI/MecI/CopY family transcriptional regulator [Mycobacterium pinniadriaticum]
MQQRGFGDLEAVVMDRIWSHQRPVTVREIFDELIDDRRIAYTTVMSTMDNLYRKQWLERERLGKAYQYWPTMTREERSARLMRAALESGGDGGLVLTHFLQQMSAEEAAQLAAALRRVESESRLR